MFCTEVLAVLGRGGGGKFGREGGLLNGRGGGWAMPSSLVLELRDLLPGESVGRGGGRPRFGSRCDTGGGLLGGRDVEGGGGGGGTEGALLPELKA